MLLEADVARVIGELVCLRQGSDEVRLASSLGEYFPAFGLVITETDREDPMKASRQRTVSLVAERAVRYLRDRRRPVDSVRLAREVLATAAPDERTATRVLEAAFADDPTSRARSSARGPPRQSTGARTAVRDRGSDRAAGAGR